MWGRIIASWTVSLSHPEGCLSSSVSNGAHPSASWQYPEMRSKPEIVTKLFSNRISSCFYGHNDNGGWVAWGEAGGYLSRGSLSRGVSVQGGSLSRGVSVQRDLHLVFSPSRGSLSGRPPSPLYDYVRAVRILLECILAFQNEVIFILVQKYLDWVKKMMV